MSIYQRIKQTVTTRQAAERYGLSVNRSGMTRCPFHEDHNPSMKLNEDYFFCFGCGASGDVIDFTSRLFGICLKDAAKKLAEDFGILTDYIPSVEKLMTRMKKANSAVKELKKEIAALEQELDGSKASVQRQLELSRKVQELDDLHHTVEELQQALDAIPPEILAEYHNPKS